MPQPSPSTDSVRWVSGAGGQVESFFLKANNPHNPDQAFWLKFTILDPGDSNSAVAEVWAIRFPGDGATPQAAKQTNPASNAVLSRNGLGFQTASCELREGKTIGTVGLGAEQISWDLDFDYVDQQIMYGLPHAWMYDASFPRNKVYTSCPSTRFRGLLSVGGDSWQVDDWPGMLGHNWGRAHNPRYYWAQCNLFEDSDCIFEGWSARLPLGPWLSPWLTGSVVRFEGQDLRFNSVAGILNRSVETSLFAWSFESKQDDWKMQWQVEAGREAFAGLRYTNPDGSDNFCLNSKIASAKLKLWQKSGRDWIERANLVGRKSCAFEILVQDEDHDVPILV
jgi:hypothetical protein